MIRHWSHARQKGWGYPPKKTACQSGLRFQRYKPLKSVITAGRPAGRRAGGPLILRFLVYTSRNSLRASRSQVTNKISLACCADAYLISRVYCRFPGSEFGKMCNARGCANMFADPICNSTGGPCCPDGYRTAYAAGNLCRRNSDLWEQCLIDEDCQVR